MKPGGEDDAPAYARDADGAVLERLPERFQDGPRELGQLVEQQHAVVGQARLAGSGSGPAADDRRRGGRMMRGAKRRRSDQRALRRQQAGDRMDPRHLERLLIVQWRKHAGQASREHRLARARRSREQQVMAPGRRQLQGPPGTLLAANVQEVRRRSA